MIINGVLKNIIDFFGLKEPYSFENRIFNAVMIFISITGLSTVLLNLAINNHISQTIVSVLCTVFPFSCFIYSKTTKNYKHLIIPTIIYFEIVLSVGWFATDGINGSIPYFFFILIIYCVIFAKKPFHFFIPLTLSIITGIIIVEYIHPEYLVNYDNRSQKFIDISFSLILCFVIVGSIIHFIFKEYIKEREAKTLMLSQAVKDRELIDRSMREIKILKGLLPICSNCKKIRDDKGDWKQLEEYIHKHSEAKFSHGLCADCAKELYPDIFIAMDAKTMSGQTGAFPHS